MTGSAVPTALAVLAMLASGCGGNDEFDAAAAKRGAPNDTISEGEAQRSPTSITCTDIQTRTEAAGHAIRVAANALAATVQLRDANQYQTAQRLIYALNDLCERADNPSFRPAADALEAVRSGRYRLSG